MFRNLVFLLVVSMACLSPVKTTAQTYSSEGIPDATGLTEWDGIAFDFDTIIDLTSIFGEPVINTIFRWRIDPAYSQVEIPNPYGGSEEFITTALAQLGLEAFALVRAHEVVLQVTFRSPSGAYGYMLLDAGDPAPGDGETWSFNVPGSPDWSEVFYAAPIRTVEDPRTYFSEEDAQRFYVQDLELIDVVVIHAEMSLHDLHEWYAEQAPGSRIPALRRAYAALAVGIEEAYGFDVPDDLPPLDEIRYRDPLAFGNMIREEQDTVDRYMAAIERLSNLPAALRQSGDEERYIEAMAEADRQVRSTRTLRFDSPDTDPATFREGGPSRFDPAPPEPETPPSPVNTAEEDGSSTGVTPTTAGGGDYFWVLEGRTVNSRLGDQIESGDFTYTVVFLAEGFNVAQTCYSNNSNGLTGYVATPNNEYGIDALERLIETTNTMIAEGQGLPQHFRSLSEGIAYVDENQRGRGNPNFTYVWSESEARSRIGPCSQNQDTVYPEPVYAPGYGN